ncbi:acyl carrier protein, partial [Streptomyces sp. NPDC052196]
MSRVAELMDLSGEVVDRWTPMHQYGLDSLKFSTLAAALSDLLGWRVPVTWMWQYPTIDVLSRALAEGPRTAQAPPDQGRR